MKKTLQLPLCMVLFSCISFAAHAQLITTYAGTGVFGYSGDGGQATAAKFSNTGGLAFDAAGNAYISDYNNNVIRKVNTLGIVSTFAGNGTAGNGGDGSPATAAQLNGPVNLAFDTSGNLYVANYGGNVVRKINTSGIISTVAGNGASGYGADGVPATSTSLWHPSCVAPDTFGNIYIADYGNTRIRKVDPSGTITTYAGTGAVGNTGDGGPATAAKFNGPYGIALDPMGNMYVGDAGNNRVRLISATGTINNFAGTGAPAFSGDGSPALTAELHNPPGIALDAAGNVYIADQFNERIRKVTPAGIISTIAGDGATGYGGDGCAATAATLNQTNVVAVGPGGYIYFCDNSNNRVREIIGINSPVSFTGGHVQSITVPENYDAFPVNSQMTITDLDMGQTETWLPASLPANGTVTALYPMTSNGGTLKPIGISYTPNAGYTGPDSFRMQVFDCGGSYDTTMIYVTVVPATYAPNIVSTIAGTGTPGYSGDGGAALQAKIKQPDGIYVDPSGKIYFNDWGNNVSRVIDNSGIVTTIAGNGVGGYSGDNIAATASELYQQGQICKDAAGNIYIAEYGNHRIRKIDLSGTITTVAGTGVGGYNGDNIAATAAKLNNPIGLAVDDAGNMYIGDFRNHRIRKVDPSGVITTIAGNGVPGYNGDGSPAISKELYFPNYIHVDAAGNVFIADNSNQRIRRLSPTGVITTIAGTGTAGYTGDNGPAASARITFPGGINSDEAGNVYFADAFNYAVRKIDPAGFITTIAGTGIQGFNTEGCAATTTKLNQPLDIAIDLEGHVVFPDNNNNRLRKIAPDHAPMFKNGRSQSRTFCQGTVGDSLNVMLAAVDSDAGGQDNWTIVTPPAHGTAVATYSATSFATLMTPTGLYYTPDGAYFGTDSVTVQISDCVGMADTTVIYYTINPLPQAGVITGPVNVCSTNNVLLGDTATGGIWSSTNTAVATIGSTGVVTGYVSGVAIISYVVTNGCGTAFDTSLMTVFPIPSVAAAVSPTVMCANDTLFLSCSPSGGSGTYIAYNWSGPGGYSASDQNPVIEGIPVSGNGVYSVTVTDDNGCTSKIDTTVLVTVNPLPVPMPTTSTPICVTTDITLYSNPTSGSGAYTTFTWSGPNGFSATTRNATIPNIDFADAGVYSVTVTDDKGCNSAAPGTTPALIVLPLPQPIEGTPVVCVNATTTLTDPDVSGAWSSSVTSVAIVDATSGVVSGVSSATVATITYTLPTGCFTTIPVTVNAIPAPISGSLNVCEGSISTLTDIPTTGTWSSSDSTFASIIPGGPGIANITGVSAGFATITYTLPVTGCFNTAFMFVNPLPTAISGTTSGCVGSTVTLSDFMPGGAWSSSNPAVASADPSTGDILGRSAGTTNISYVMPSGCAVVTPFVVQVSPKPITGGSSLCEGSTLTLSDIPVGGTWSSGDASIATVTTGISSTTTVTGVSGGAPVITYKLPTGCYSTKTITVNPLPPLPSPIGGVSSLCVGNIAAMIDGTSGGAWHSTNTAVASVNTSGTVYAYTAGTTTISYTTSNGCGAFAATVILTVNPLPTMPAPITGTVSVCPGSSIILHDALAGGIWSSANTAVATVDGAGNVFGVSASTVLISYTESNMCGSASVSRTVTVNPLPVAGVISGVMAKCVGLTSALADPIPGGTWASSALAAATVSSSGVVTAVEAGTSTISYTVTNVCGSALAIALFTVNPLPAVPAVITGPGLLCIGSNTHLVETVGGGVWSTANTLVATVDTVGVVTGVDTGTSVITYTTTTICGSAYGYRTVTVNTLPLAGTIGGAPSVCMGSLVSLTDVVPDGIWSSGNSMIAAVDDTGHVAGINEGSVMISYTTTNNCGSTSATATVVVHPLPQAGIITGKDQVCIGDTIILTDNVTGGVWTSANTGLAHVTGTGIVSGVAAGTDTLVYSVTNSCGTASVSIPVSVLPYSVCRALAGQPAAADAEMLKVYPNPNNGTFTVLLTSASDEPVTVVITNMVGQKVKEVSSLTNRQTEIGLNMASGVYFVAAVTEHGQKVAKVTVE